MTSFESGDIVLVRYPFTDLSTLKKRPAVILSAKDYSERFGDVVLIPLTSVRGDEILAITQWQSAGLLKPSWLKPIIGTLAPRFIEKRLGKLSTADIRPVRSAIAMTLDRRWIGSDVEDSP